MLSYILQQMIPKQSTGKDNIPWLGCLYISKNKNLVDFTLLRERYVIVHC